MTIEQASINKTVKNAILSLFIYALPVLLMLLTFYLSGERPWQKAAQQKQVLNKR